MRRKDPEDLSDFFSHTDWVLLTREEMLKRAMASDGEYDRVFITGVLSTGIYCLPSCRARKPKPENVQFFDTIEQARAAGLRACKKCRPDDFFEGVDLDLDRIESVVSSLRSAPETFSGVGDLCEAACIGSTKLFESVRRHYHTTPGELIARSRVDAACKRLLETQSSVADIAFDVGFETLSTFYEHFGRLTGMAPTAFRKLPLATSFSVNLPEEFREANVLGYFGRDPQSVCEAVDGRELWLSTNLERGPAVVHLRFEDGEAHCDVVGGSGLSAHRGIVRILGLRQDPKGFEQQAIRIGRESLFEGRAGLRMPLTFAPYDAVIWSIVGQQVNLAFAYTLRRRLAEFVGTRLTETLFSPPSPSEVARLQVEELLPLQFSRRKAEYLIGMSRQIDEGLIRLDEMEAGSATRAEQILLGVRGLGPWSAHYLLMRGFGFADCLPVGDTGLTSALQKMHALEVRPDAAVTRELLEPFSPHRSLACLHLWQSLKFES